MSVTGIESLLIQGGIAGVFAIFTIVLMRESLRYLRDRDGIVADLAKHIADLTVSITVLTGVVDTLCDRVDKLKPLNPKTRPRRKGAIQE